jgi:hypothetical protein
VRATANAVGRIASKASPVAEPLIKRRRVGM